MNQSELLKNLQLIQTDLDAEVPTSNILEIENKLNRLSSYMGLSAECLTFAKKFCLDKQRQLMASITAKELQPLKFKYWLEGEMSEELMLQVYADRINAGISHCCDSLRTIISKYKSELEISKFQK